MAARRSPPLFRSDAVKDDSLQLSGSVREAKSGQRRESKGPAARVGDPGHVPLLNWYTPFGYLPAAPNVCI